MALNEALNGGNANDREGLLNSLQLGDFGYVLRVYIIHSIDYLTDPEVLKRIPVNYRDCFARELIADVAKEVLMKMTEDELGNLNQLGRISFGLGIED